MFRIIFVASFGVCQFDRRCPKFMLRLYTLRLRLQTIANINFDDFKL